MAGSSAPDFLVSEGDDAREVPGRLLVVQEEARPTVDVHDEEMVMTFPHLFVREMIAIVGLSFALVVVSLLFDAPLEELANAEVTPNPAKAPWYFLGLQELLHYYPPLVSGVVIPGLVVVALMVVPYFNVNLHRTPFWETRRAFKLLAVTVGTVVTSLAFYVTGAHPVWPVIGPTVFVGLLMLLPGLLGTRAPGLRWVGTRSLAFWIFLWFLLAGIVLSIIGVFFRGPGWSFTLPWVHGVF